LFIELTAGCSAVRGDGIAGFVVYRNYCRLKCSGGDGIAVLLFIQLTAGCSAVGMME